MGRFADPTRTATLVLPGGCQCPGTPHARDEWEYRLELGESELRSAGVRALIGRDAAGEALIDLPLMQDLLIETASVAWNLVGDDGALVPIRPQTLRLLDETTRDAMLEALDETQKARPDPN